MRDHEQNERILNALAVITEQLDNLAGLVGALNETVDSIAYDTARKPRNRKPTAPVDRNPYPTSRQW